MHSLKDSLVDEDFNISDFLFQKDKWISETTIELLDRFSSCRILFSNNNTQQGLVVGWVFQRSKWLVGQGYGN